MEVVLPPLEMVFQNKNRKSLILNLIDGIFTFSAIMYVTSTNDDSMPTPNMVWRHKDGDLYCKLPLQLQSNMHPMGKASFGLLACGHCPMGYHMGLALGPLDHEQEARPLNVAYRRDVTETTSEVGTIRCNFLTSYTNLNCALSQEWI